MILVEGATGELGSRVVSRLRGQSAEVRALVRPGRDAAALEELGAGVVRGDFTDRPSLAAACEGAGERELEEVKLYDRFLAEALPADVRAVFEAHRRASFDDRLPVFQRCATIAARR